MQIHNKLLVILLQQKSTEHELNFTIEEEEIVIKIERIVVGIIIKGTNLVEQERLPLNTLKLNKLIYYVREGVLGFWGPKTPKPRKSNE